MKFLARLMALPGLLALPALLLPAHAQVFTFTHDEMLKYTVAQPLRALR